MPVTMKDIDALRSQIHNDAGTGALDIVREGRPEPVASYYRGVLDDLRDRVETLLRLWWEQGCKEVP